MTANNSLLERLGGFDACKAVVDAFLRSCLASIEPDEAMNSIRI